MDLEKKVATFEPLVKSLSTENEMLKNKVTILTAEAENDKERVATLEKSLQVEKDFCKLKDKLISDLELKLENVGAMVVQDFKDFDEYFDELCKYYVEGFDLLVKSMDGVEKEIMSSKAIVENVTEEATDISEGMKEATVITLGFDLFGLAMDGVEKELLSSKAIAENVTKEATDVSEGMKETTVITPAEPVPDEQ